MVDGQPWHPGISQGDATLGVPWAEGSVDCAVTSPPWTDDQELVYVAGVIDSDGTTGGITPRIQVKQVTPEAIDLFRGGISANEILQSSRKEVGGE